MIGLLRVLLTMILTNLLIGLLIYMDLIDKESPIGGIMTLIFGSSLFIQFIIGYILIWNM